MIDDITVSNSIDTNDLETILVEHNRKYPNYAISSIEKLSNSPKLLLNTITESFYSVYKKFEEGGRWSNYETNVYKITDDLYIEVYEEVPATEMQAGGYFSVSISKVKPQEKVVIEYVVI